MMTANALSPSYVMSNTETNDKNQIHIKINHTLHK